MADGVPGVSIRQDSRRTLTNDHAVDEDAARHCVSLFRNVRDDDDVFLLLANKQQRNRWGDPYFLIDEGDIVRWLRIRQSNPFQALRGTIGVFRRQLESHLGVANFVIAGVFDRQYNSA